MNFKKMLVTQDSCNITREQMQFYINNEVEIIKSERNGKRLLRKILEQKPEFIIMDMIMYELDALEVIAKVKSSGMNPLPMFIVTTGVEIEELDKKVLSFGAKSCLLKPVDMRDISNLICSSMKAI